MADTLKTSTLWGAYGAASLAAVLLGCWVARATGTASPVLIMNLAAWGAGAGLALLLSRTRADIARWWLALAVAGLALTLVSGGLSGVHRWIALGPIRLNSAELLLPLGLAACAGMEPGSRLRLLFPLAVAILLAAQPDLSQAVAAAAAAIVVLITSSQRPALRAAIAFAVAAAVVIAAVRPDPLEPVATVEGIIGLAKTLSPALAALAIAALTAAVLTPLLLTRSSSQPVRHAALALSLYGALCALAPAMGAYPVPLVGMGVSPILGAWLGIGWLMARARLSSATPRG